MDDGTTMRIDAVRSAVNQFLEDPSSAGLSVGIGYFGTQPLSCACTSCNAKDYATPAVGIGALPANVTMLESSLKAQQPTGDPRRSLEERYPTHDVYVEKVSAAAARLVADRFLLPQDAELLVSQAKAAAVP